MYYGLLSLAAKVPASGYDSDAQAFFTAAGITDTTQKSAVNQLVLDLKSYSIWTKMKALYPMVGGTSTTHSYNLKNTSQYQLTFNGGWTHSSTGALPNGTNAYANTGFNASTQLTTTSGNIGVYLRNDVGAGNTVDFGASISGNKIYLVPDYNGSTGYASYASEFGYSKATTTGLYSLGRLSSQSSNVRLIRNGSTTLYDANPSAMSLPNGSLYLGAYNNEGTASNFAAREQALAYMSDGLTNAEIANLYTAVQTFQTTLGRQVGTPIPFAMPLDTYSGAAAAYSAARRLSSTYTGALIRVRRSSDNTEQDIGYNGSNVLDESALTSFVGAGNGFVTTWYDQSGNGRNAIQSTASNQPQIVSSGSINKLNSKAALRFDQNNNNYLDVNSTSVLNIQDCISTFTVANFVNNGGYYGHIMSKGYGTDGVYSLGQDFFTNKLQLWIESDNITFTNTINKNTQYLFSNTNIIGSNGIKLYTNGALYGQSTTTNDLTGTNGYKFTIGRNNRDNNYPLDGNIQEIICYPTYLQSSRTSIESNINTFYSIY